MRRVRWRWTAALPALLLLLGAGRCAPAAPAPSSGPGADALSALVEFLAARAEAGSVTVASAPGYARERIPAEVRERIGGIPGLGPTALADFERRNAVPAPLPQLHPTGVVIREGDAGGAGTLTLRLSAAGISASGDQALVIAETVCGSGCVSGEAFLLRREGGAWRIAETVTLFIS